MQKQPFTFLCVIPARLQSTRFPEKVLHLLDGIPMIVHVYRRALEANCCSQIIVATDSPKVENVCRSYQVPVILTSDKHPSGFDRIVEVAQTMDSFTHYLNLQGDEPAIHSQNICSLAQIFLENPQAQISTSAVAFQKLEDYQNPNQVKVVLDNQQRALYFSRSPIPYFRDSAPLQKFPAYKHQGIYAYKRETLLALSKLERSPLELAENLEQLRFLSAGFPIHVAINKHDSLGIDSPEDIEKVLPFLK